MEINIRKAKEIFILDLRGNFDVDASGFIEIIGDLLNQGVRKMACNFEGVEMMDYMGLSALAIAYKNVTNHKALLRFFNVPAHVKKIFSMLLLDDIFEIYATEDDAIKSFQQDEAISEIIRKKLRRRFKRLPIQIKITFKPKFSSSKEVFEGLLFNLSAIGAFVFTKNISNLNEILTIWLPLGSSEETIEVEARVVWLADRQIQPQTSPGMGIEFYNISTKLQEKIVQYVNKNLSRQSSFDVLE